MVVLEILKLMQDNFVIHVAELNRIHVRRGMNWLCRCSMTYI